MGRHATCVFLVHARRQTAVRTKSLQKWGSIFALKDEIVKLQTRKQSRRVSTRARPAESVVVVVAGTGGPSHTPDTYRESILVNKEVSTRTSISLRDADWGDYTVDNYDSTFVSNPPMVFV